MKIKIKTVKTFTLTMSEDQVEYIIDMTRNYIGNYAEGEYDKKLRDSIFTSLHDSINYSTKEELSSLDPV